MMKLILVLLLYVPMFYNFQVHRKKVWKDKWNSFYMGRRMILLMQTLHREGMARHKALNNIRFMYEESPHYEMGYIVGEILERYKKMLSHVRRRFEWENVYIHDLVRRVQTVQHLYFEIYNLQRMMHEMEVKYRGSFEFQDIHSVIDMQELAEHQEAERLEMENIALKKKRELRKLKKIRKKYMKIHNEWQKYQKPEQKKGMWPIEYGWDIGTDWLYVTNPYGF